MGLFNKSKLDLNEAEAIFCLLFAVMFLDGDVNQAEIDDFGFIFNRIKAFEGKEVPDFSPKFQSLYEQYDEDAKQVADAVIPFISKDNRLAVFTYCLEIIFSDADIGSDEEAFIHHLIEQFGLEDGLAANAITIFAARLTV